MTTEKIRYHSVRPLIIFALMDVVIIVLVLDFFCPLILAMNEMYLACVNTSNVISKTFIVDSS